MKIIIKNDNRDIVKNPNIKIIETTEASFTNQIVFIEENDVPIIKYTDTESMYFIKNLDNLYDRKSKSEVLLNITTDNLELINNGNSEPVDSRPYKVYTALLTQTGTNAPVATVLENTTGLNITYSYAITGQFNISLGTTIDKDLITLDIGLARYTSTIGNTGIYFYEIVDDNSNLGSYTIHSKFRTNASATISFVNNALMRNKIEIKIYE